MLTNRVQAVSAVLAVMVFLVYALSSACVADAASELKLGEDLLAAGNLDAAIRALDGVASGGSALAPKALQLMGTCYLKQRDWQNAAQCYSTILSQYPGSVGTEPEVKCWIMDCYFMGDEKAGMSLLESLLKQYPEQAFKVRYVAGRRCALEGSYSRALVQLKEATKPANASAGPEFQSAKSLLVRSYIGVRDWENALNLVNQYAIDYPDDEVAWRLQRGAIYHEQGRYAAAIADLRQGVSAGGSAPVPKYLRMRLAKCYRSLGDRDAAVAQVQALMKEYPADMADWQLLLGRIYENAGLTDKAVSAFKEVIVRYPDARWQVWEAHYYLAECLYPQGRADEALDLLKCFYGKRPARQGDYLTVYRPEREQDYLMIYGKILCFVMGDFAKAASVFEEFLTKYPNDSLAWQVSYWYVGCLAQAGQFDKAESVAKSVLAKSEFQQKGEMLRELAGIYYGAKKYGEAAELYEEDLRSADLPLDFKSKDAYQLGFCYWKTGSRDLARQYMRTVSEQYSGTEWAPKARTTLDLWARETSE